jgi:predicted metal-dependent hydrolase
MISSNEFKNEVYEWARKVGVDPKEIHLRGMKRKIASCSAKGRLTFDPSILENKKKKRSEIILHELLHLRYPNHGKMFDRIFESYLYQQGHINRVTYEKIASFD